MEAGLVWRGGVVLRRVVAQMGRLVGEGEVA
jgi:hypothetical protein